MPVRSPGLLLGLVLVACGGDDAPPFTVVGELGQPVPMAVPGWVPVVEGHVGSEGGDMLIDTGAPATLLDRDTFVAVHSGQDAVYPVDLSSFAVDFQGLDAIVYNLFGGTPDAAPAGIVGGDILSRHALWLDYRGLHARLYADGDAARAEAAPDTTPGVTVQADVTGGGRSGVPGDCGGPNCGVITLSPSRFLMRGRLENQATAWILVDTGASAVVFSESQLAALGGTNRPRLDGVTVTTANGPVTAAYSRLARVELLQLTDDPGAAVVNVPVLVLPDNALLQSLSDEVGRPVVALVGGSFLRNFQVVIDEPAQTITLARYSDEGHIPADEYIGVGFTLLQSGADWQVGDVYQNTDADLKGVTRGDSVLSIGGTSITGLGRSDVDAILAPYTIGMTVPFELSSGSKDILVEDLLPTYMP